MKWSLIIVLCSYQTIAVDPPINCDLKKQAEGIKVFTCKTDNERFRTLRAEFVIRNTTIYELQQFLMRVDNYHTWQYNTMHAETLKEINADEFIYVSDIDAPWPVEDRELMMNFKVTHEPAHQRMQIEMHTIESAQPVKEGFIRVPFMHGHWTVIQTKNNALDVAYVLRIDPGGTIPAWLVNLAMAEGPYISFRNLKKQLEK